MIRDTDNPCPVCFGAQFIIRERRIAWPGSTTGRKIVNVRVACPMCAGNGDASASYQQEALPAGYSPVRHW